MKFRGQNEEFVELKEIKNKETLSFDSGISSSLHFVWIKGPHSSIGYDGEIKSLEDNTILCLTSFHRIEFVQVEAARMIKFNREFYCVLEHDSEVSCKGLLFYAASQLPFFVIPPKDSAKFEALWKVFEMEMQSQDTLQLEMLQMVLKRFIILCTRLYKNQVKVSEMKEVEVDIVREFQFLVETHFKSKHTVKEYADLLNKSPKTLSNIFSNLSEKTPLQIIHERKILEAKRMLRYTDKSIKEIAYELGFEDIQTFSRFFKRSEKMSPSDFKSMLLGSIANSSGLSV